MKYQYIITVVILICSCCNEKNEFDQKIPEKLIGKWEAIMFYSTDGTSEPKWSNLSADRLFFYTFLKNGNVLTNRLNEKCTDGRFSISDSILISFNFPCISYEWEIESLTDDSLVLDTKNFEPLKYKFFRTLK